MYSLEDAGMTVVQYNVQQAKRGNIGCWQLMQLQFKQNKMKTCNVT